MRLSGLITLLILLMHPLENLQAQQASTFGDYEVHYSAVNSDFISVQVAQSYDIKRSPNRALLSIAILDVSKAELGLPVKGTVTAQATNLIGNRFEIEMREIIEQQEAIYYIGEFSIHNLETFRITVNVTPINQAVPFEVKFQKQFYTE